MQSFDAERTDSLLITLVCAEIGAAMRSAGSPMWTSVLTAVLVHND